MPVDPLLSVFLYLLLIFGAFLFFLFVIEKDGKTCLNTKKDYFDNRTPCEASIRWSNTLQQMVQREGLIHQTSVLNLYWDRACCKKHTLETINRKIQQKTIIFVYIKTILLFTFFKPIDQ